MIWIRRWPYWGNPTHKDLRVDDTYSIEEAQADARTIALQMLVIDGCSTLLLDVLGDRGRHTRSAIGVASLPAGLAVEIEAIFEVS